MTKKPQIELTIKNTNGGEQVVYPYVEAEHVTLENGMLIEEVIEKDIMTPNVIHQETNFKVGAGDQDVSSSIVDSTVGKMVIKGQTYQNILPEPSTHVLSNNKESFKVNEGVNENIEFVDGVAKSAILKGNTLVNLNNYNVGYKGFSEVNGTEITFTNNGTNLPFINLMTPYTLKPNTKYTVIFDIINNPLGLGVVFYHQENASIASTIKSAGVNQTGLFKFTLDTNERESNCLRIVLNSISATDNTKIKNIVILEGDYVDQNIPYFEGMQSVKMPVLTTTGKNLFNKKDVEFNYAVGNEQPFDPRYVTSNYIAVKPSTQYVVNDSMPVVYGFDINKEQIGNIMNTPVGETFTTPDNCYFVRIRNYEFNTDHQSIIDNAQLEMGSSLTPYEPFKSNILSTPEDLELRGIDDVQDTLDLMAGEVVQNIYEFTLDGSQNIDNDGDLLYYYLPFGVHNNRSTSDKLPSITVRQILDGLTGVAPQNRGNSSRFYIKVNGITTKEEMKNFFLNNPTTIQCILETPIIKTVDLTTSGNWEKAVLDGSESWQKAESTHFYTYLSSELSLNAQPPILDNSLFVPTNNSDSLANAVWYGGNVGEKNGNIVFNILDKGLEEFKQYLSQNPLTVWYQTATHKDSTNVKQPIFFKDGYITQSSGVGNSLIPTLDYQAKTSNSYVMDLMKNGVWYTMKAKSANGTLSFDSNEQTLGTNRKFAVDGASFKNANKVMVINGTVEELMVIEGDVTSKTIPYFKGIKSAFEGENEVEVLSTGKNLYPYGDNTFTPEHSGWYFINGDRETLFGDKLHKNSGQGAWFYLEGGKYFFSVSNNSNVRTLQVVGEQEKLYGSGAVIPKGWYTLRMNVINANEEVNITNIMVEKYGQTTYEPYKTNVTKIPLLSSLRSLPNGVCDEVVVDRKNSKATLIQRIGNITFDGSSDETWHTWGINNSVSHLNSYHYVDGTNNTKKLGVKTNPSYTATQLAVGGGYSSTQTGVGLNESYFSFSIPKNYVGTGANDTTSMCENKARQWLSQNPITLYYELATPVITEVDLDNFPYIYKDGHIFLNSEIAPISEITYAINQQHQIEASNEDLIRHEQEISYLYKLIAQYIQVDYQSTLLALDLEMN